VGAYDNWEAQPRVKSEKLRSTPNPTNFFKLFCFIMCV
jgi:hypothetical protein